MVGGVGGLRRGEPTRALRLRARSPASVLGTVLAVFAGGLVQFISGRAGA